MFQILIILFQFIKIKEMVCSDVLNEKVWEATARKMKIEWATIDLYSLLIYIYVDVDF